MFRRTEGEVMGLSWTLASGEAGRVNVSGSARGWISEVRMGVKQLLAWKSGQGNGGTD